MQRSKKFIRPTEGGKCQCGNELPGLLTLPVLFIYASEINGNTLEKPNISKEQLLTKETVTISSLLFSIKESLLHCRTQAVKKLYQLLHFFNEKPMKLTAFTGKRLNVNFQL